LHQSETRAKLSILIDSFSDFSVQTGFWQEIIACWSCPLLLLSFTILHADSSSKIRKHFQFLYRHILSCLKSFCAKSGRTTSRVSWYFPRPFYLRTKEKYEENQFRYFPSCKTQSFVEIYVKPTVIDNMILHQVSWINAFGGEILGLHKIITRGYIFDHWPWEEEKRHFYLYCMTPLKDSTTSCPMPTWRLDWAAVSRIQDEHHDRVPPTWW
jgi:hypothetical protein